MLRSLDLFSGIGGFTHGLRDLAKPVAYCEIDPDAIEILKACMGTDRLAEAPICPMQAAACPSCVAWHGT